MVLDCLVAQHFFWSDCLGSQDFILALSFCSADRMGFPHSRTPVLDVLCLGHEKGQNSVHRY